MNHPKSHANWPKISFRGWMKSVAVVKNTKTGQNIIWAYVATLVTSLTTLDSLLMSDNTLTLRRIPSMSIGSLIKKKIIPTAGFWTG